MRRTHQYSPLYHFLGKLIRGFFILLYGFSIISLLLVIGWGADPALTFFSTCGPWLLKLGLTLGCGIAVISLIEALP